MLVNCNYTTCFSKYSDYKISEIRLVKKCNILNLSLFKEVLLRPFSCFFLFFALDSSFMLAIFLLWFSLTKRTVSLLSKTARLTPF